MRFTKRQEFLSRRRILFVRTEVDVDVVGGFEVDWQRVAVNEVSTARGSNESA